MAVQQPPSSEACMLGELKLLIDQLDQQTKATMKDSLYRISRHAQVYVHPPSLTGLKDHLGHPASTSAGLRGSMVPGKGVQARCPALLSLQSHKGLESATNVQTKASILRTMPP